MRARNGVTWTRLDEAAARARVSSSSSFFCLLRISRCALADRISSREIFPLRGPFRIEIGIDLRDSSFPREGADLIKVRIRKRDERDWNAMENNSR